jgi:hypothetical protein
MSRKKAPTSRHRAAGSRGSLLTPGEARQRLKDPTIRGRISDASMEFQSLLSFVCTVRPQSLWYKLFRSSPRSRGWDAMRIFAASTLTLLLLTSVAFSQQSLGAGENANTWTEKQDADAARAAVEEKKQKELDAQYKAALGRTKTTAPSDPWGDVRSVKAPATGH